MSPVLLYKMTIWTGPRYDDVGSRGVLTIEAYFKVALDGSIHENRQFLPDIGVPFFQDWVQEQFGISVSRDEINIKFEAEEPAYTIDTEITVDFRVMTYRGKQVSASTLPSRTIELDTEEERGESEEEPSEAEAQSYQEYLNHRDNLVNAYARGYRDGSISAGFPTSFDTARKYGREFVETLSQEDVWSWEERDAYDQGRLDAQQNASEEQETEDYEDDEDESDEQ